MGLFDVLTGRTGQLAALATPVHPGLETPNQSSALAQVVYSEYFTGEISEVTRLAALQIPAIKKARDVLVGIAASLQLIELEGDTIVDQPWLYRTTSGISPWHRIAYVLDDVFFYDWSALAVDRDAAGQIIDAIRIPIEQWHVDPRTGSVTVDFVPAQDKEIILIPGNGSGGILAAGANTIRGARALERSWIGRAQNPIPLTEIHQITDDQLTDDEVDDLVDAWAAARTSTTGATGFTDNRVEIRVHGAVSTDLFEEGRNAIVLDIARLTGVPASILDGSQSTASLTYSTQEGKRNEFDDYTLPMWLGPIEARLSLDDVSAEGRVIRFDKSSRNTPTAPTVTDPKAD
jgi:hypothetical protein